jgi:hypothetical protein
MKLMLPLTLTAMLIASQAMAADCAVPKSGIDKIPNGSQASKDDLLAARRAVNEYDAAVKSYNECLKTQQDAELAAAGDKISDDQRTKIVNKYVQMSNAQVDKLQKLADQLNAEIRAFKAKNPS